MKAAWATVALVLAAGLLLAEPNGGGTQAEPDKGKPAKKEPLGNPNKAEPGLEDQGWKPYDATYVPVLKDWNIKTFSGGYAAVSSKDGAQVLALPVKDKPGVAVKAEDFAIEVDPNGDGKFEERLKSDGSACLVSLTYDDGTVAPYAIRVQKGRGATWNWQRSGYWTATINKTPVGIIDNNNNGIYDENGQDAISVGLNGYATPMSEVVNLGGTLYRIKIAVSGKKIWVKEYEGDTGKLDARSGHRSLGILASAVFQNGQTWIDVTCGKDKAILVPAGSWEFFGGECRAASGSQSAMMRKGSMAAVQVKKDETAKVVWGMDLKIDFDFDVNGGSVAVQVASVHVYGQGGEEYYGFTPPAFTPIVTVWNLKTGEKAQTGKMCLS